MVGSSEELRGQFLHQQRETKALIRTTMLVSSKSLGTKLILPCQKKKARRTEKTYLTTQFSDARSSRFA
jgi:hypothetical protein